jgi:hypothetical protein
MPLALSVVKRKSDGQGLSITGRLTASGTYPTGGDDLDLSKVAGITNRRPDIVIIVGKAGFIYQYDHANKKMFVYVNTAGGANAALGEHTNIAYVAGITGDDIRFIAFWLTIPNLPDV